MVSPKFSHLKVGVVITTLSYMGPLCCGVMVNKLVATDQKD